MKKKYFVLSIRGCIIFVVFLLIFLSLIGITSNAQTLADDYAPIYYFEGEETCYPIDAQYHLDNSQYTCIDPLLEETCFYDNTQGTINDDGVINHYKSVKNSYNTTVYYRVYSSGITDVIQYWMFYAFNKGELNQHEGDWEMVQVVLENNNPSWVGYSQHHDGQRATWAQVEKDGNHIKVYVSRGSHANYLRSFSGKLGIASDIVGANGKELKPSQYTLDTLEDKDWIDYEELWGEVADDESGALAASALGQAGPPGPKFREDGAMWDNPISWGESLGEANDMMFIAEMIVYNFILIFLLITVIIIVVMVFRIYRRHKKYGLGPRIVSMFYINGFNLHSIGNILCIIGIVVAIFSLINPWYQISYNISGQGLTDTFQTEGLSELMSLDGINGLQVTIPGTGGPTPMGSFILPFSLFIAIGLVFLIFSTIGISLSKKLGSKYIWRGIRLIIPFIIIIIVIVAISIIVSSYAAGIGDVGSYVDDILGPISGSPFGGQTTTFITDPNVDAQVDSQWGFGTGGWLLLISGIIMLVAGILEFMANSQFFITKTPLPGQALPSSPAYQPPVAQQPPPTQPQPQAPQKEEPPAKTKKPSPKAKSEGAFCTECGAKLEDKATFCVNCGKKLE